LSRRPAHSGGTTSTRPASNGPRRMPFSRRRDAMPRKLLAGRAIGDPRGGGASESEPLVMQIDQGTLILTTKRVIFDGTRWIHRDGHGAHARGRQSRPSGTRQRSLRRVHVRARRSNRRGLGTVERFDTAKALTKAASGGSTGELSRLTPRECHGNLQL
jgi:hypothetical protein